MDQDDSMLSTPSSHPDETYDDENLFPDTMATGVSHPARPQTPQNDHLNAAAPGELSPPRSHSNLAVGTVDPMTGTGVADDNMDDLSPTAANRTLMGGGGVEEEWKPGAGWKSKKAQEDMQRAWENVVDRDFSVKEFGDVMGMRGK